MKQQNGNTLLTIIILVVIIISVLGFSYWFFINKYEERHLINDNTTNNVSNSIVNNVKNTTENTVKNLTSNDTSNTEVSEIPTEKKYQKFTFKNEFGDGEKSINVEAEKCFRGSGYAGASSNVYYLKDGTLYHLELGNLTTEVLANGVKDIEEKDGEGNHGIIAYQDTNYSLKNENNYITYKK